MTKTALIAGASGLVGGHCLNVLREGPDYGRIIVLTRRELPAEKLKYEYADPKIAVEQRIVDFSKISVSDVSGADDVFCALGTTIKKAGSKAEFRKVDFDAIVNLAKASVEAGAKQFVFVSSVGADPKSSNFYLRVKGETEQAVTACAFEAVHIMRPSLLLGQRQESRTGEGLGQALMPKLNWVMAGPLRKYRAIPSQTVARAMVGAARSQTKDLNVNEYDQIVALSR